VSERSVGGSVIVSCCGEKLVVEAADTSGTPRRRNIAIGSCYQVTAVKTWLTLECVHRHACVCQCAHACECVRVCVFARMKCKMSSHDVSKCPINIHIKKEVSLPHPV
jgi:hypothetical protein